MAMNTIEIISVHFSNVFYCNLHTTALDHYAAKTVGSPEAAYSWVCDKYKELLQHPQHYREVLGKLKAEHNSWLRANESIDSYTELLCNLFIKEDTVHLNEAERAETVQIVLKSVINKTIFYILRDRLRELLARDANAHLDIKKTFTKYLLEESAARRSSAIATRHGVAEVRGNNNSHLLECYRKRIEKLSQQKSKLMQYTQELITAVRNQEAIIAELRGELKAIKSTNFKSNEPLVPKLEIASFTNTNTYADPNADAVVEVDTSETESEETESEETESESESGVEEAD